MVIITMQLILFVLGMFFDPTGIVLLTAPIFFPLVVSLGFDPLWFAILFVINMEIGLPDSAVRLQSVLHESGRAAGHHDDGHLQIVDAVRSADDLGPHPLHDLPRDHYLAAEPDEDLMPWIPTGGLRLHECHPARPEIALNSPGHAAWFTEVNSCTAATGRAAAAGPGRTAPGRCCARRRPRSVRPMLRRSPAR